MHRSDRKVSEGIENSTASEELSEHLRRGAGNLGRKYAILLGAGWIPASLKLFRVPSPCTSLGHLPSLDQHPSPVYRVRRASLSTLAGRGVGVGGLLEKPPLPTRTNPLADPSHTPQTSSPRSRSPYSKSYPLTPKNAPYTLFFVNRPKDILFARANTHLFHALPLETDARSPRGTYPTGSHSPWPGPAPQSQPGPACDPQSSRTLSQLSQPPALGLPWRARPSS